MKLAIFLQHYFPYGGLQRDALRLAQSALQAGHDAELVVSTWNGEEPTNIPIRKLNTGGLSNHSKAKRFADACSQLATTENYQTSIGFSRIAKTPFHFCGDACLLENMSNKPSICRLLPRYKTLLEMERSVFGAAANNHIFFLSENERQSFAHAYDLLPERSTVIPPWVSPPTFQEEQHNQIRREVFEELGITPSDSKLLVFVGSNFKLKRAHLIIESLAQLAPHIHLAICGDDDPQELHALANNMHVANRVHIMGPRNDIPRWLTASDLLVHPSIRETAGMVLVEALTYGTPVTCTSQCGYAQHIKDAGGTLLSQDCHPDEITEVVNNMLANHASLREKALKWSACPSRFSTADIILDTMARSIHP